MLRLRDYQCTECGHVFEDLTAQGERPLHCGKEALTLLSAPAYIWKCDRGGSTAPRRFDNHEPRRREAKRERVSGIMDRQGMNEKNNTQFMDPATARKT